MTALSVLNRYGFRQLRPDENGKAFVFSGPGLVVIACETSSEPHEIRFRLLTAVSADVDALEMAKSMLRQRWSCDGYVFALLAAVPSKDERLGAISELAPMCKAET